MTAHPIDNIRNFSIVAHIDHGKSTLADRLIQQTGAVAERDMVEQVLDSMDIERERGITIKAQTVRLDYKAQDGKTYILNLMDTPGHVDFAYEVSRSLAACEGSLLVVDASQGVEAQTLANVYHALDAGHEIVPVLNKIDLPAAEPDRIKQQIEDVIGLDASQAVPISAKTGLGVDLVLEAIIHRLPPPKGDETAPLKALLVDSWYDAYLGVVVMVRILDGSLKTGMRIRMMGADAHYEIDRVGVFRPKMVEVDGLGPGEIGYITAQIKQVADTRVGDTITDDKRPTAHALPGFKPAQPVVFCGLFPTDAADFEALARRWASCGSTTPASPTRWRPRRRSASASAAASSVCCISRSFRSGWSASSTSTSSPPRRASSTGVKLTDGSEIELHNPVDLPDLVRVTQIQRAVDQGDDPDARRLSRRDPQAVPGPARDADRSLLRRQAGDGGLRAAAQRSRVRFLRPAEVGVEGLRLVRLPDHRLPPRRPGQDVDPGQRRGGRRAVDAGSPRARRDARGAAWSRSCAS